MHWENKVNTGTRIGSMIMDHFLMTLIAIVFFIPFIIKNLSAAFTISHEQADIGFNGPMLYVSLIGFSLYFCKDLINGRSPGKRITRLQVVDNYTGQTASPMQCFIRNLFCVIWPVEVLVTLANPQRRIGDRVAGTKVVVYDPGVTNRQNLQFTKIILPLIISYTLSLLAVIPLQAMTFMSPKVRYVASSYNEAESKSLEKLFADSLGQRLTASVKVYDKIENQNLKYISVICLLKENHLEDHDKSAQLRQFTNGLLYSKYPIETFTGRVKYIFSTSGSIQSSSDQIGTATKDRQP